VISIERAVATKHASAWIAPACSRAAGLALQARAGDPAGWLQVLAAAVFLGVNVLLLHRQRAPHTALLVASALAWWIGNVLFAFGADTVAVLPWWFAFLVVTIAAERLEMTRLMRRRAGAQPLLYGVLVALAAGAALSGVNALAGGLLYGAALLALSFWLFTFDIARRTVRAEGLSRYLAVCLLSGYSWLAVAGIAWALTAAGQPVRDVALHALGLGFILSMIMGHAPVILPAIARVKLQFGGIFYLPLVALHASLLLRLGPGLVNAGWRAQGALLNALAIALFALTVVGSILAWHRRFGASSAKSRRN
jgi:hypothetical protein